MGIDPLLHSANLANTIVEKFALKNIHLKTLQENPIDRIWLESRSTIPDGKLRIHPEKYAGKSVEKKLSDIREILIENKVSELLLFYVLFYD